MIQELGLSSHHPLFVRKTGHNVNPMTAARVRITLSYIRRRLNLHEQKLGFHSFRRSGASYAFNHDVNLQILRFMGKEK